MPSPETWRQVQSHALGLMATVAQRVQLLEIRGELRLESFRSRTCYITSDYGGQTTASRFQTYSFLFCDLGNAQQWLHRKVGIRDRLLPHGRRIGYKEMGDGYCRQAFLPFLDAADLLPGLSFTLAVDKRIPTLFGEPTEPDRSEWIIDPSIWKPAVFEKVLRVVHFAGLFTSLLSVPGQNLIWISDEDDIASNAAQQRALTSVFGNICGHYLTHQLGHARVGTTAYDDDTRDMEDFAAIPDLLAGAVAEIATNTADAKRLGSPIIAPLVPRVTAKASYVLQWMSRRARLQKAAAIIRLTPEKTFGLSWLRSGSGTDPGLIVPHRVHLDTLKRR